MNGVIAVVVIVAILAVVYVAMAIKIFKQYERGVQLRLGKLIDGPRGPG